MIDTDEGGELGRLKVQIALGERRVRELERENERMENVSKALASSHAELREQLATATKRAEEAERRRDHFKRYVHERLDAAGVPVDPPSPHREHGCRIGGRLDWVFAQLDSLRTQLGEAERAETTLRELVRREREDFTGHRHGLARELSVAKGDLADKVRLLLEATHESDDLRAQFARATARAEKAEKALGEATAAKSRACDEVLENLHATEDALNAQIATLRGRLSGAETERDEARKILEGYDIRQCAIAAALTDAGIPCLEPYPDEPGIAEWEKSLRAAGRVIASPERVRRLAADRDATRAELQTAQSALSASQARLAEVEKASAQYVAERNKAWEQIALAAAKETGKEPGEWMGYEDEEVGEYVLRLRVAALRSQVAASQAREGAMREWVEIGRALGNARERAGTLFADVHQARADMETCAQRARALLKKEIAAAPESQSAAPGSGEEAKRTITIEPMKLTREKINAALKRGAASARELDPKLRAVFSPPTGDLVLSNAVQAPPSAAKVLFTCCQTCPHPGRCLGEHVCTCSSACPHPAPSVSPAEERPPPRWCALCGSPPEKQPGTIDGAPCPTCGDFGAEERRCPVCRAPAGQPHKMSCRPEERRTKHYDEPPVEERREAPKPCGDKWGLFRCALPVGHKGNHREDNASW